MKIIDEIRNLRISVVIPTMNRKKLLNRFIIKYVENCPLKTDFVFVNSGDSEVCINSELEDILLLSGNNFHEIKSEKRIVGYLRNIGIGYAVSNLDNEFIFTGDDDCYIGKLAVEKMLAPIYQNNKYAVIGHLGGYRCFMRDFKPDEIRFHAAIGVFWCTRKSIINIIGNVDSELIVREDSEFQARCWHNNYWTAIVDADVKHKRFQPIDSGVRTIPENYSPEWNEACSIIEKKYPDIFKNRSGKLYRQFKFPEVKYHLDDDLKLLEVKKV